MERSLRAILIVALLPIGAPLLGAQSTPPPIRLGSLDLQLGMTKDALLAACGHCALQPVGRLGTRQYWIVTNPEVLEKHGSRCPPDCLETIDGTVELDAHGRLAAVEREWGRWPAEKGLQEAALFDRLFTLLRQDFGEGAYSAHVRIGDGANPDAEGRWIEFTSERNSFVTVRLEHQSIHADGSSYSTTTLTEAFRAPAERTVKP